MSQEAHFTEKDRETLENLALLSVKVETKLDRAIVDIAGLSGVFATKEEVKDVKKDFGEISKRVDKIEGNLGKVVWVVISAVILAVLGTVLTMKP